MNILGRKKYLRSIIAVALCVGILSAGTMKASAQSVAEEGFFVSEAKASGQADFSSNVRIKVNGALYSEDAFIYKSVTYVGIRQFSVKLGASSVSWDNKTRTATVVAPSLTVKAQSGTSYMEANGRYLWLEKGIIIKDGTMYVPIRAICKAFGYSVEWIGETREVLVNKSGAPIEGGSSYYDSESVLWLSRIIHAEAKGESLLGKIAVGNVVLNRKESSLFPNTIYGVIFDRQNGVQFTPTVNGAIYNTPGADSVIAAKLCLEGASILPDALFFVNVKTATNSWVSDNRECITVIGNHSFFA